MPRSLTLTINTAANLAGIDSLLTKIDALRTSITSLNTAGGTAGQILKSLATETKAYSTAASGASRSTGNLAGKMTALNTASNAGLMAIGEMAMLMNRLAAGNAAFAAALRGQISATSLLTRAYVNAVRAGAPLVTHNTKFVDSLVKLHSAVRQAIAPIQTLISQIMKLVSVLGSTLRAAFTAASNAARGFANSTGTLFAGLMRAINSTQNAFVNFGRSVANSLTGAQRAMRDFYNSGWSLLTSGRALQNVGQDMFKGLGGMFETYMGFEKAAVRTAISASTDVGTIREMIFNLQRGMYTPDTGGRPQPIMQFDAEQMAEGIYFYTSAIGQEVTRDNMALLGPVIANIMQMAAVTRTGLETATKGVLNAAMEFGINPRDVEGSNEQLRKVAAQMGYLANLTTMEVPDIAEAFKMVGPMAHVLSGEEAGAGLNETFALIALASDVGLRGGNVGRGINQMLTTILDPSGPAVETAAQAFGFEASDEAFRAFFLNADDTLRGGLPGLFEKLATLSASEMAGIFTTNASRAVIGMVEAAEDMPGGMKGYMEKIASTRPEEWLSEAFVQTNNTIFANLQNLQNAWFSVTSQIVSAIEGPVKSALRFLADLLWNAGDVIAENPWIGQFIAGLMAIVSTVATVGGSLLMFGGSLLLLLKGFHMLMGISHPVLLFIFSVGKAFLILSPIILLIAAAVSALSTAWESNFMGMRSAFMDFKKDFTFEDTVEPIFEKFGVILRGAALAFHEFIGGILLGVGSTSTLGAVILKIFGPLLGPVLYTQLLRLRDALDETRTSITNFFNNLGDSKVFTTIDKLKNAYDGLIRELFEFKRYDRVADNPIVRFAEGAINAVRRLDATLSPILGNIRVNLSQIFTADNLYAALNTLAAFMGGVFVGFASTVVATAHAFEALTRALANAGQAGDWITKWSERLLGFKLTVDDLARAVGVGLGAALGFKFLRSVSPSFKLMTLFIPVLKAVGTGVFALGRYFIELGAHALVLVGRLVLVIASFVAQLAIMATVGAITTGYNMVVGALAAGKTALAASELASTAATTANSAATTISAAATITAAGAVNTLNFAIGILLMTLGLILAGLFSLAAIMLVAAYRTDGWAGVWEGLVNIAKGFWSVLQPTIGIIYVVGTAFLDLIGSITGMSTEGERFVLIGQLMAITLIALAVVAIAPAILAIAALVGAVVSFIAANAIWIAVIAAVVAALYLIGEALAHLLGFDSVFEMLGSGFSYVADAAQWAYEAIKKIGAAVKDFFTTTREEAISVELTTLESRRREIINSYATQTADDYEQILREAQAGMSFTDKAIEDWYKSESSLRGISREQFVFEHDAQDWDAYFIDRYAGGSPTEEIDKQIRNLESQKRALEFPSYDPSSMGREALDTGKAPAWDRNKDWKKGLPKMEDLSGFFNKVMGAFGLEDIMGVSIEQMMEGGDLDTYLAKYSSELSAAYGMPLSDMLKNDYEKAVDNYTAYENMVKKFGKAEADALYQHLGQTIPTDPGPYAEWMMQQTGEIEDAEEKLMNDIEQFNKDFMSALTSLDIQGAAAGLFGEGSVAAIGLSFYEQISTNLGDTAPWMNETEFLADLAISGLAGQDISGKNIHRALGPALEGLAQETGLTVNQILKDIPKFIAPEEYIPLATAELAEGIASIGDVVDRQWLDDSFGTDLWIAETGTWATQFGIDWAEVTAYGAGKALADQDWNLADYISESWGISVADAEAYLASHGIDSSIISDEWFEDTEMLARSLGGQVNLITEEWYNWLQQNLDFKGDMTIEISEEDFNNLPEYVKLGLSGMGYTFVLTGKVNIEEGTAPSWFTELSGMGGGYASGAGFIGWTLPDATLTVPDMPGVPTVDQAGLQGTEAGTAYITSVNEVFTTATFDYSAFETFAQSAASTFKNSFQTAMSGWEPTTQSPEGAGAGLSYAPPSQASMRTTLMLDTTAFDLALTNANISLNTFATSTWTGEMAIDRTDATTRYNEMTTALIDYHGQVYTGIMSLDTFALNTTLANVNIALNTFDTTTATATLSVNDYATWTVNNLISRLDVLDGKVATSTIRTINETQNVQKQAVGGISRAALQWVGEEGPELAALPSGTRVQSTARTMQMLRDAVGSASAPRDYQPLTTKDQFRRGVAAMQSAATSSSQGEVKVEINNLTIAKEVDIDNAYARIQRLMGRDNAMVERGMIPFDAARTL